MKIRKLFLCLFTTLSVLLFEDSTGILLASDNTKVEITRVRRKDLRSCAKLVVSVFFQEGTVKRERLLQAGLSIREEEESCFADLSNRLGATQTTMFLARVVQSDQIQYKRELGIVGFAEVCSTADSCFKLGPSVPFREFRPQISSLVVHGDFRRLHIGMQLTAACVAEARVWGHEDIMLEVRDDNLEGIKFYRRLGFQENLYWRRCESKNSEVGLYMRSIVRQNNHQASSFSSSASMGEYKPPEECTSTNTIMD